MGRLIEEERLRNKTYVFNDRAEAGRLLSERLSDYKTPDAIVLAIPAGGVPVAFEIANALGLIMDIIIVRKIQIPDNPEAGFGIALATATNKHLWSFKPHKPPVKPEIKQDKEHKKH